MVISIACSSETWRRMAGMVAFLASSEARQRPAGDEAHPQHHQEPGRTFHRLLVTVPRATAQDFNIRHKTGYYADSPAHKD